MKKYIIAITLFCISLILIDDAYALNTKGWGHNINTSSRVYAYDCTSANTCTNSLTVNTLYETDSQNNLVYGVNSYITGVANDNGGLGFVWAFNVANPLKAGYLYNITGYFCNHGGTNIHLNNIISGNSLADITGRTHPLTYNGNGAVNEISNMPFYDGTGKGKCHYISRFIVPSTTSQYIGMQIGSDDFVTTTWEYYGYTLTELGTYNAVTKDDLNSAIKNSGLASADSIEEVEESVQNVQENINSSIQESTDNINQGIKDGFENCRDSYNLLNVPSSYTFNGYKTFNVVLEPGTYTIHADSIISDGSYQLIRIIHEDTSLSDIYISLSPTILSKTFTVTSKVKLFWIYSSDTFADSQNTTTTFNKLMLNEGSSAKPYEEYGKQVCSNRIDATNDKLDNLNDSINSESENFEDKSCGMICKLGKIPGKIIDGLINGLKSLFIPDNTDFINNFVDSIENKLGFIASIPMQFIEFILGLVNASWETFDSISLPSIDIFGYNFWDAQEIDLTEAINIFKPFRYVTDVLAVVLFCNTLLKWWENFTGGKSS